MAIEHQMGRSIAGKVIEVSQSILVQFSLNRT